MGFAVGSGGFVGATTVGTTTLAVGLGVGMAVGGTAVGSGFAVGSGVGAIVGATTVGTIICVGVGTIVATGALGARVGIGVAVTTGGAYPAPPPPPPPPRLLEDVRLVGSGTGVEVGATVGIIRTVTVSAPVTGPPFWGSSPSSRYLTPFEKGKRCSPSTLEAITL